MENVTNKLMKPEDVASALQMSPKTIKDWLRMGKIKGIKIGKLWRIEQSVFEEYMDFQRMN